MVVLDFSPGGATWKIFDDVLSEENPLLFTCGLCGKTSTGYEPAHFDHCGHPYKGEDADCYKPGPFVLKGPHFIDLGYPTPTMNDLERAWRKQQAEGDQG